MGAGKFQFKEEYHRRKVRVATVWWYKFPAHIPEFFFGKCTNIVYDIQSG